MKTMIEKLFSTIFIMFIVLTLATIPIIHNDKVLRASLEIEENHPPNNIVYLKNKDNYLVKADIYLPKQSKEKTIPQLISYLKEDNSSVPINLKGYIPKDTELLNYRLKDDTIFLDFSKELLQDPKEQNQIITGIVYTLLELNSIDNIEITVEGKELDSYPKQLNKTIGINQKNEITSRKDIKEVTVYYLDQTNSYLLPITKYINTNKSKIEVIINELKNPTEENVISPIDNSIFLKNYKEDQNVLYLNFNKKIDKKTLPTIIQSCFANYDVNMVMIEINSKVVGYWKK